MSKQLPLRYAVRIPFLHSIQYLSKHRTLAAAEREVRRWTRKYNRSGIPSIIDLTTGNYV